MKRIVSLCLAFLLSLLAPVASEAGPITVTWEGEWSYYNGDALASCLMGGGSPSSCSFFEDMASLGIHYDPQNTSTTDSRLRLALTMEGSLALTSSFSTPVGVHFGAASLSFSGRPVVFGLQAGPDYFGLSGNNDPAINPILGKYQPAGLNLNIDGLIQPQSGSLESLFQSLLIAPPHQTFLCLSLTGGDCDVYSYRSLNLVSVTSAQIPEASSLALLLPPFILLALCARRSYKRATGL